MLLHDLKKKNILHNLKSWNLQYYYPLHNTINKEGAYA